ncbi:MAG: response regulator transcription factor [Desulfonatronovibrionaceae bacterium]
MEAIKGSRILLVEDEASLARGLKFNLEQEGYVVVLAGDGREALDILSREDFDLIVLDIMLPRVDGFEVAVRIREENARLPILILTARTSAKDRIRGLEIGADDYLTKPFHLAEFLLRVEGMLTRKQWYGETGEEKTRARIGDKSIDFHTREVETGAGEKFRLTVSEANVLQYLIQHKGEVLSRKELLKNVWRTNTNIETRTVDAFIARLRKYFEDDPKNPEFIKSVRGSGYIFENEK